MKTFVIFLLSFTVTLFVQFAQEETSLGAIGFSVASGFTAFGLMHDKLVRKI